MTSLRTARRSSRASNDEPTTRVLFVTSGGGHLSQLLTCRSWWSLLDRSWVASPTPDVRSKLSAETVTWSYFPTTRHLPNAVRNFALAVRVLVRERPDVVISTGAGVAYPFFVVSWILRIPSVWVEVYDRIDSMTMTGRLCRPLATTVAVQWDEQRALYPEAHVIGPLL